MGKVNLTIQDLFDIPGAVIYNPDTFSPVSSVAIDSRKVKKGSLFVAIKGENFDGHEFVKEAIKKGAKAVLINEKKLKMFNSIDIPLITVKDTAKAYGDLARIWRNKLSAKIISITGSNGKTTTKDMIAELLSEKYKVVKTEANNNNHIGVPLTIFSANEKCEVLVLEQGTNHFKEIEYSADISQPDLALITNIGDSHVEFLKNKDGVYKEKSALFDAAIKHGGKVCLNYDDPIIKKKAKKYSHKITYGFAGKVEVKGKILGFTNDGRTKIKISHKGKNIQTTLPVYGESNAENFLAASVVALNLRLSGKQIVRGSQKMKPPHGRLEVQKFNKAVLIDDSYNSSPASIEAAYDLVKKIKLFKNKIVVLGDIFELGKNSAKIHRELSGLFFRKNHLTVLTIGQKMKLLHKELRSKKIKAIHFNEREALSLYLQYEEIDNSVILVKGSRGMKMEAFVKILEHRFE